MKDIILMAVYVSESVQSQYMPPCHKYFRTYASHPCCLLCCTPIPWQTFDFDYLANEILNEVPLVLSPRYTARFSAVADKRLASWNNRGQSEIAKIVSRCQSITVNDLRLHYTTENACHMTIHAGKTIEMYK